MSIPCLTHALGDILSNHLGLNKSRVETFVVIIVGLVNGRTVNLSHIACHFCGPAKHASNYRRLQRFFQHVRLDKDWVALMMVRLLNQRGPWLLALDRINWKRGTHDISILMLALVTRRFRVPLMWVMLDKPGSSNTAVHRPALRSGAQTALMCWEANIRSSVLSQPTTMEEGIDTLSLTDFD